jgi:flagellar motor switch protein FliG
MSGAAPENPPPKPASPAHSARRLSGPDKVAALLLAMGKPLASQLLKHFDEADIKLIAKSASTLGRVSRSALDEIISEFSEGLNLGADLRGSMGDAEELLAGVVSPEAAAEIMQDVRGSATQQVWPRIGEIPVLSISQYLSREHPQVAAFVLSKAGPATAAAIMGVLSTELRNELMRRMLSIKHVPDKALKLLELTLADELVSKISRAKGPAIHARLADIINKLERRQMEEVLTNLDQFRPKEAKLVKSHLFTFDDIVKLTQEARLALFDQVTSERVILALKGAPADLSNLVLSCVSARSKRMIEAELSSGAAAPAKEIAKARRAIADLALELAERGMIELNPGEEGESESSEFR